MPRSVAEKLFQIEDTKAQLRMINAILNYEFRGVSPEFQGEELALFERLISDIKNFGKKVHHE